MLNGDCIAHRPESGQQRAGMVEFPDSATLAGFRLAEAARLYAQHFQARFQDLDLDFVLCSVLLRLAQQEGVTQQRLAQSTVMNPAAMVRILDRLEAGQWVERRPRPGDRRARSLAITPRAKALMPVIREAVEAWQLAALKGVSRAETQAFVETLTRILTNLKALQPGRR